MHSAELKLHRERTKINYPSTLSDNQQLHASPRGSSSIEMAQSSIFASFQQVMKTSKYRTLMRLGKLSERSNKSLCDSEVANPSKVKVGNVKLRGSKYFQN